MGLRVRAFHLLGREKKIIWQAKHVAESACQLLVNPALIYARVETNVHPTPGTSSLAAWMAHHPALRWVSNDHHIGKRGEEAHVLDEMGAEGFNEMLGQGTAGKYGRTAPVVASESDRVIDCEYKRGVGHQGPAGGRWLFTAALCPRSVCVWGW